MERTILGPRLVVRHRHGTHSAKALFDFRASNRRTAKRSRLLTDITAKGRSLHYSRNFTAKKKKKNLQQHRAFLAATTAKKKKKNLSEILYRPLTAPFHWRRYSLTSADMFKREMPVTSVTVSMIGGWFRGSAPLNDFPIIILRSRVSGRDKRTAQCPVDFENPVKPIENKWAG